MSPQVRCLPRARAIPPAAHDGASGRPYPPRRRQPALPPRSAGRSRCRFASRRPRRPGRPGPARRIRMRSISKAKKSRLTDADVRSTSRPTLRRAPCHKRVALRLIFRLFYSVSVALAPHKPRAFMRSISRPTLRQTPRHKRVAVRVVIRLSAQCNPCFSQLKGFQLKKRTGGGLEGLEEEEGPKGDIPIRLVDHVPSGPFLLHYSF
jgi:hypothetical protein